jgi:hypothetical protein
MLKDQSLSLKSVKGSKKITIDFLLTQKNPVIKISLTPPARKRTIRLCQETRLNQKGHIKNDGHRQKY